MFSLVADFAEHGATRLNIKRYKKLDEEIIRLIKASSKKACKKKYGYARSPALVRAGQILVLYKALLDCKARQDGLSDGCVQSVNRLAADLKFFDNISV